MLRCAWWLEAGGRCCELLLVARCAAAERLAGQGYVASSALLVLRCVLLAWPTEACARKPSDRESSDLKP